jgi:hypothetical protein
MLFLLEGLNESDRSEDGKITSNLILKKLDGRTYTANTWPKTGIRADSCKNGDEYSVSIKYMEFS